MTKKQHIKIVKEGKYLAEVNVELIENGEDWSPYLSVEDANRLDEVRAALIRDDIKTAAKYSKVYTLHPVAI